MEKNKDGNKKWLAAGVIFLAASMILKTAAKRIPGFADWYTKTIYPLLVQTIGRAAGIFPFSVAEIGIYLLIVFWVIYMVHNRKKPAKIVCRTVFLVSILLFSYMMNCGVNYYRKPFSSYLELDKRKSSKEELYELCEFLTEQVNEYSENAGKSLSIAQYNQTGVKAMENLGKEYPVLGGFYPKPKALLVPEILSVQQLAGIYAPFTIEANYNRAMTPYNIPHTLCHELSHLKGFMREDEANFIGYLACISSDQPEFVYSGYLLGWIYATNALAGEDMEEYVELYKKLDGRVVEDLRKNSEFWDRYDGKVAETADKINDTYLKMNDQKDGVKSYGRVVDLMLAHYRKMEKKS